MNLQIELLNSLLLTDFPSGSSIDFYNEKLYVTGDDANHVLILDCNYKESGTINLFASLEKRVLKKDKPDLEASTVLSIKGHDHLVIIGSASTDRRKKIIIIPLASNNNESIQFIDSAVFIGRLKKNGIQEVNIEGATVVGDHFLLSNRGNRSNPGNDLIVTRTDFWVQQETVPITVSRLNFQSGSSQQLAVSELHYEKLRDVLFLTLSSEETSNAYDDGVIGDSYLGIIRNVSDKIGKPDIAIDLLINLPAVHTDFTGEKIEGICSESVAGNTTILHLVSDNDLGQSKLFKLKLTLG